MSDEHIKKMLEDNSDDPKEDTFCSMARDLYNKKNLATLVWVWGNGLIFLALAVFSSIKFFKTDQTQYQIMYAAIFICCFQVLILTKIVCWQTMHKNRLTREIKELKKLWQEYIEK